MMRNVQVQPAVRQRMAARARSLPKFSFGWLVVYIIKIALVAFMALPMISVVCTAFKPLDELFIFPPQFFVRNPTSQNFVDLMSSLGVSTVPFLRYVLNSLVVTVSTVSLTCLVCSAGAYGMVVYAPTGSKFLFNLVVSALMFSPHVTQIPRYMVVNGLNLVDNYLALILPSVAVAYNFFLVKQFMGAFPRELIEAGRIDGAGELHIFFKLVMPAMKPAMATLIVLTFVSSWNDYFSPLIYTSDQAMRTLPLALQTISGGAAAASIGRAGAVSAATMVMTIPTVLLFTVSQRMVMETMTMSGIKG